MKNLLLTILLSLLGSGVISAMESHLDYHIPDNADKYGPITTRDNHVTYTKYYKNGAKPENRNALIAIEYHRKDQLIERKLYKEGLLHGIQKQWYPSGKLENEAPYKKGIRHGLFQHWNDKGQLLGRYEMVNGTGSKVLFDEQGKLTILKHYKENKENGWSIYQHFKHHALSFIQYIDDEMVNTSFSFYALEKIRTIINFNNAGDYHGPFIRFNMEGGLKRVSFYLKGNRVSKMQYIEARKKNKDLPPILVSADQYKKAYSIEFTKLITIYKSIEQVKFPLQFNKDGSIVTASGKPFILPK